MAKLFFLFSGENETLPPSELKGILEAEGYTFKILENLDQTIRLESGINCVDSIMRRAAFTRICGLELFSCEANIQNIMKAIHSINIKTVLEDSKSFAVRVKRVKNYALKMRIMEIERKLGKYILENSSRTSVNLKNPEKTFFGILTGEKLIFGAKLAEIQPKSFMERRPRKKPFFHPSAMPSKLARCMINLAKTKAGELVLDPFCGTGSILVEAALIGCYVLGFDVQRHIAKGCIQNMKHFNLTFEGLIVADARKPPITDITCVVTDPPYGRASTTLKCPAKQVVEEVLTTAQDLLSKGGRICIASPRLFNIAHIGVRLGYKHLESHFIYVHRTLTREIAVFEKV